MGGPGELLVSLADRGAGGHKINYYFTCFPILTCYIWLCETRMRLFSKIERMASGRGKPEINRLQKGTNGTRKNDSFYVFCAFLRGKGVLPFSPGLCCPSCAFVFFMVNNPSSKGSGELRLMNREALKTRKSLILSIFADISCVVREIVEPRESNHFSFISTGSRLRSSSWRFGNSPCKSLISRIVSDSFDAASWQPPSRTPHSPLLTHNSHLPILHSPQEVDFRRGVGHLQRLKHEIVQVFCAR